MASNKLSPQEQKTKLLEEKKKLEQRIAEFDTRRAAAVGMLAKKYKLTDLSDEVLETEFKAIQVRHQHEVASTSHGTHSDQTTKKN